MQTGVTVEPFFIGTEDKPFDPVKFYSVRRRLLRRTEPTLTLGTES